MRQVSRRFGLKEVRVHFGTFDYTMNVIVGPGRHIRKYLDWKFEANDHPPFDHTKVRALCFLRPGYAAVVWIPKKPTKPCEIASLAHEILHVLRHMLVDWAGIPLTRDTDEAFCHAMSFALNETLVALK